MIAAADTRSLGEKPRDPSMEEILASIRRIIADEQASVPVEQPVAQPVFTPRVDLRPVQKVIPDPGRNDSDFENWLAATAAANAAKAAAAPPAANLPPATRPDAFNEPGDTTDSADAPDSYKSGEDATALRIDLQDNQSDYASDPAITPQDSAPQEIASYEYESGLEALTAHELVLQTLAAQEFPPREAILHAPRLTVVPPASPAPVFAQPVYQPPGLDSPVSPAAAPESLLSAGAGTSVQSSFQALSRTMFMQNTGMVEDAVRDMLRPMLKQWLDDNLPVVVERLVRAEIERVARSGR